MALTTCEDCTREISTRATSCPHCGCPVHALQTAGPGFLPEPASARLGIPVPHVFSAPASSGFECGQCGSENVKRLSLIYRDGLSVVNTATAGAAVGRGGAAGFGAATAGTQQNLSSMGAAPPPKKSFGGALFIAFIGLLLLSTGGGATLIGLMMLGGGGYFAYAAIAFNRDIFPGLMRDWENTFVCQRCAHRFVHGRPLTPA